MCITHNWFWVELKSLNVALLKKFTSYQFCHLLTRNNKNARRDKLPFNGRLCERRRFQTLPLDTFRARKSSSTRIHFPTLLRLQKNIAPSPPAPKKYPSSPHSKASYVKHLALVCSMQLWARTVTSVNCIYSREGRHCNDSPFAVFPMV